MAVFVLTVCRESAGAPKRQQANVTTAMMEELENLLDNGGRIFVTTSSSSLKKA
jgi:hypothetical protein